MQVYKKRYYNGHHSAHAALGFYDGPFERALVISFDSGGSDGTFNAYHASWDAGIKLQHQIDLNLGLKYMFLGSFIANVSRTCE
jgi:carbamoyltransferase